MKIGSVLLSDDICIIEDAVEKFDNEFMRQ